MLLSTADWFIAVKSYISITLIFVDFSPFNKVECILFTYIVG